MEKREGLYPVSRWERVEARVEINCFQTLVIIPLNRAVVFPIPEIAVASSANPNFIHKDQPRIIGFDGDLEKRYFV